MTPKWKKNTTPSLSSEVTIPLPDFHESEKVSLNFSGKTELRTVLRTVIASPTLLARLIYENRPYASYAAFKKKIGDAALQSSLGDVSALLDTIANDQRIVLHDVEEA